MTLPTPLTKVFHNILFTLSIRWIPLLAGILLMTVPPLEAATTEYAASEFLSGAALCNKTENNDTIPPGPITDTISDTIYGLITDTISGSDANITDAETGLSAADSLSAKKRNWWKLLWKGEFNVNDSTIHYPRFVRFCYDVYKWGDRTFNSYDTTYVVGTGRNWKARIAFDAWTDSYHMNINRKMPITLISTPYSSAGVFLHFMAVSVNYSVDLSNLFFNKPVNHKKFEFGFNCARFNVDIAFNNNTGGSNIRRFGKYHDGHIFRQYFSGVNLYSFTADLYYYFNNRKYANGAAYYFSKFQKKSAGSFILGFNYAYEDIGLDFTKLPEFLLPYATVELKDFKFNYHNYCLLLGYGFNWVINPRLLYNITVMPSVGVMHCTEDSSDGSAKLLSLNAKGRMSLTYNHDDFFICLIAKADGHWYKTGRLSVFSAIENASLSLGIRF